MNAIVKHEPTNAEAYRASTDAASLCREIVLKTAKEIQGRQFVSVEGWQAIAIAHGCTAASHSVERIDGGVRAIGEVRRMVDGALISQAEGFVGEDEATWFGGTARKWRWGQRRGEKVWYDEEMPKRPDYAIRAMAQTRSISRACRSAFAHVVVMVDAGLSTTPAEEIPANGFDNGEVIDQAPEPDRRVVNPETGRMVDPMSANQARKDGRGERAAALANEIDDLAEVTEALAWRKAHEAEVAKWPAKWQTGLWDKLDAHIDDLRAIAAREAGANAETGEIGPEIDPDGFPGDWKARDAAPVPA